MTLLKPATKEIFAYAALGGTRTSRTPRWVSRTSVNGSTPGTIGNAIGIIETSSPALIGIIGTDPPCGLNLRQKVGNIQKFTSPGLVRQSQNLDAVVYGKFSDNCDSTPIFRKLINDKLFYSSSRDLYTICRMNFTEDTTQIQTPQLVDLGLSTINDLDEDSGISTPAIIIRRPTNGSHRSALNNMFDKTTAVGLG